MKLWYRFIKFLLAREAKRLNLSLEEQEKLCTDCKRWYSCNQIKPITPQTLACDVFEEK